ncbi:protein of unknown function DUF668 [Dillenia turbinata]|uniref:DUF668 domain-containing protein n=1 Tax=Dillenia turbinata TaxID=194707 RepID=A0AAN8VAM6_9MAGN
MGAQSSKGSPSVGSRANNAHVNPFASRFNYQNHQTSDTHENQSQDEAQNKQLLESYSTNSLGYGSSLDDFYDGIPRYSRPTSLRSRSFRSTQAAVAKVSEVSSRLGKGLGKAVDALGSSVTNLNSSGGFVSGVTVKGNELSILSFEVANTILKGSNLMQSLSSRGLRNLKEVVLLSEGVQLLVSNDMDELLRIVAADKREELKVFAGEVVRFGNRCRDSQWHNLDRFFEKFNRELNPQKQLKESAEVVMQQLMTLVQQTAELCLEMHLLDKMEHDYQRKRLEAYNPYAIRRADGVTIAKADLKNQKNKIRNLKKKSLWSRSLEEVMGKLVDIVRFLILAIHDIFDSSDDSKPVQKIACDQQRLGPAGLDMHYANIILQIDTIAARSNSIPPNLRELLYLNLPPKIKSALRSKLHSFHIKEELTVSEIRAEMEKTLQWLAPVATNTAKAHHGFGWVGEWAGTGSEVSRKQTVQTVIMRIETLYHADKAKTEAYILELVLWLHHLVSKSRVSTDGGSPPLNSRIQSAVSITNQESKNESVASMCALTIEDQERTEEAADKKDALESSCQAGK